MRESLSMFIQIHINKIFTSILLGALFILPQYLFSQQDTLRPIDVDPQNEMVDVKEFSANDTIGAKTREHSPRIAVISSTIIPGLGQAYNRKYWKVPIIYGSGAVLYFFYDYNNTYYQRLNEAYSQLSNGQAVTDPELVGKSLEELELNRDNFRRNRDYNIIFMGLLYVANIVDAMVDAHMYKYDISRDLTMQIGPTIIPPPDMALTTASCGVKVKFSF